MNTRSYPEYIQIETNIICNAKCPFCTHKQVTRRPKVMPDDIWKKIIDETRGLGITYRPFLINEPLTDPRMGEIMRYIRKDSTAKIELNTNGALMTEEMAREILDAGIDVIRFSIDGFTKETFEKSRIGLDFDTTVERTAKFIEKSQQRGGAGRIEVRMIDMDYTKHEQKDFKAFWSNLGAKVVITTEYSWPWEPGVECVLLPCLKMLSEMFFYVNGKATLCCWDTNERAVIGDVSKDNVLDIWNGSLNQEYRRILAKGRRDKILLCSRCDAYKDRVFEGFTLETHQT